MKRNGLSLRNIGENPTISILLICKAVQKEAIPRLYNDRAFSLNPDNRFSDLPKTLMQNIKALEINTNHPFYNLAGVLEGDSDYEPDNESHDDALLVHEEDASLWRSTICALGLQSLTLLYYGHPIDMVLMYRHYAKHGLFRSKNTQIYLHAEIDPNPGERDESLIKNVSDTRFVPVTEESCIIPAVEKLTLRWAGLMCEAALLSFQFGGCRLVCVKDEDSECEDWRVKTYEIIWPSDVEKTVVG